MYPAVVTAVLLLASIQVTETAGGQFYPDEPCGDGWSRFDENLCAKHINTPKPFHEAEKHCRTLNAELVSLHSRGEMFKVICLTWRADPRGRDIWIGALRSGNETRYIDGSAFNVPREYFHDQCSNCGKEACIKMNVKGWGWFSETNCLQENNFVCVKKVSTSTADPE